MAGSAAKKPTGSDDTNAKRSGAGTKRPAAGSLSAAQNNAAATPVSSSNLSGAANQQQADRKVALFVGTDVTAHVIVNELIPLLREEGIKPTIYMTAHRTSSNPDANLFYNRELAFIERDLLKETYDFLSTKPLQNNDSYICQPHMSTYFAVDVHEVDDVNDPAFIKQFEAEKFEASLSLRCYQKFSPAFIKAAEKDGVLWNMHPGRLRSHHKDDEYRGIMTGARIMIKNGTHAGWTLHVVDQDYDTGPIVDRSMVKINKNKPMMNITLDSAPIAADRAAFNLAQLLDPTGSITLRPQKDPALRGPLFSHLTSTEHNQLHQMGYKLADVEQHIKWLVEHYTDMSTPSGRRVGVDLALHLVKKAEDWYTKNAQLPYHHRSIDVRNCLPSNVHWMLPAANQNGPGWIPSGGP